MGQRTEISWTDYTWNPIRGCSRVSEGCRLCYAEAMAARFSQPGLWGHGYATKTAYGPRWTGKVELIPEKLAEPLSWRMPRRCFVNSTSDLFHERLSFEDIAAVYGVMAACPHITFQVLTKRTGRRREWYAWCEKRGRDGISIFPDDPQDWRIRQMLHVTARRRGADLNADRHQNHGGPWPLPNVLEGTSVENQETADRRIPELLKTPAAVRFVSYEPALGPVDFQRACTTVCPNEVRCELDNFSGHRIIQSSEDGGMWIECACSRLDGLDWIIVGGESGPNRRSCDLEWIRSTVWQCQSAGVACFVKQDSGPRPGMQGGIPDELWAVKQFPEAGHHA